MPDRRGGLGRRRRSRLDRGLRLCRRRGWRRRRGLGRGRSRGGLRDPNRDAGARPVAQPIGCRVAERGRPDERGRRAPANPPGRDTRNTHIEPRDREDRERIALGVGVVGEDVDRDRHPTRCRRGVVSGPRRIVHRHDADPNDAAPTAATGPAGLVLERDVSAEVRWRGVENLVSRGRSDTADRRLSEDANGGDARPGPRSVDADDHALILMGYPLDLTHDTAGGFEAGTREPGARWRSDEAGRHDGCHGGNGSTHRPDRRGKRQPTEHGTWANHESGPITSLRRPSEMFRNARTTRGSNCSPAQRAISSRATVEAKGDCRSGPR